MNRKKVLIGGAGVLAGVGATGLICVLIHNKGENDSYQSSYMKNDQLSNLDNSFIEQKKSKTKITITTNLAPELDAKFKRIMEDHNILMPNNNIFSTSVKSVHDLPSFINFVKGFDPAFKNLEAMARSGQVILTSHQVGEDMFDENTSVHDDPALEGLFKELKVGFAEPKALDYINKIILLGRKYQKALVSLGPLEYVQAKLTKEKFVHLAEVYLSALERAIQEIKKEKDEPALLSALNLSYCKVFMMLCQVKLYLELGEEASINDFWVFLENNLHKDAAKMQQVLPLLKAYYETKKKYGELKQQFQMLSENDLIGDDLSRLTQMETLLIIFTLPSEFHNEQVFKALAANKQIQRVKYEVLLDLFLHTEPKYEVLQKAVAKLIAAQKYEEGRWFTLLENVLKIPGIAMNLPKFLKDKTAKDALAIKVNGLISKELETYEEFLSAVKESKDVHLEFLACAHFIDISSKSIGAYFKVPLDGKFFQSVAPQIDAWKTEKKCYDDIVKRMAQYVEYAELLLSQRSAISDLPASYTLPNSVIVNSVGVALLYYDLSKELNPLVPLTSWEFDNSNLSHWRTKHLKDIKAMTDELKTTAPEALKKYGEYLDEIYMKRTKQKIAYFVDANNPESLKAQVENQRKNLKMSDPNSPLFASFPGEKYMRAYEVGLKLQVASKIDTSSRCFPFVSKRYLKFTRIGKPSASDSYQDLSSSKTIYHDVHVPLITAVEEFLKTPDNDPLVPGKDKYKNDLFPKAFISAQDSWIYYHIPRMTSYPPSMKERKEKVADARRALESMIAQLKDRKYLDAVKKAYLETLEFEFFTL